MAGIHSWSTDVQERKEGSLLEWRETWDEEDDNCEVLIILPGVAVIPSYTFSRRYFLNVEILIMGNSVRRIENHAFMGCHGLIFIRFSTSLEYIGQYAFFHCGSLPSVFIPPSCQEIDEGAFHSCQQLGILHVPPQTRLGICVIGRTALLTMKSNFNGNTKNRYNRGDENLSNEVNRWIKNNNQAEEYSLHRACSSFNPLDDIIYEIVREQGLQSLKKQNNIGIAAMQYLEANLYAEIEERKIINCYVLDMMGEIVL